MRSANAARRTPAAANRPPPSAPAAPAAPPPHRPTGVPAIPIRTARPDWTWNRRWRSAPAEWPAPLAASWPGIAPPSLTAAAGSALSAPASGRCRKTGQRPSPPICRCWPSPWWYCPAPSRSGRPCPAARRRPAPISPALPNPLGPASPAPAPDRLRLRGAAGWRRPGWSRPQCSTPAACRQASSALPAGARASPPFPQCRWSVPTPAGGSPAWTIVAEKPVRPGLWHRS